MTVASTTARCCGTGTADHDQARRPSIELLTAPSNGVIVLIGTGHACFANVIDQVALYCKRNKVRGDAQEIALRLRTFVHGAASLLIDQDYDAVAPKIDINQLIAGATPGLLAGSPGLSKR